MSHQPGHGPRSSGYRRSTQSRELVEWGVLPKARAGPQVGAGQTWPRAPAGCLEYAPVGGCSGRGVCVRAWVGGGPGSQTRDQSRLNCWLIRQGATKHLERLRGPGQDDDVRTLDREAVVPTGPGGSGHQRRAWDRVHGAGMLCRASRLGRTPGHEDLLGGVNRG